MCKCLDCGKEYDTFPDFNIPNSIWEKISPDIEGNGILCLNCTSKRLDKLGLWYESGLYDLIRKPVNSFNKSLEEHYDDMKNSFIDSIGQRISKETRKQVFKELAEWYLFFNKA